VRLDPGQARAWYNLGLVLNSDARTEEALEALGRAESADSSDARSPYARATILARLRKVDEARSAAQRALEIEPRFEPARELLRSLATANRRGPAEPEIRNPKSEPVRVVGKTSAAFEAMGYSQVCRRDGKRNRSALEKTIRAAGGRMRAAKTRGQSTWAARNRTWRLCSVRLRPRCGRRAG
jgi:tetratricopeptide (TPR) repeat protein